MSARTAVLCVLYVAVEPCLLKRGAAGQLEARPLWDEKGSEQTEISRKVRGLNIEEC